MSSNQGNFPDTLVLPFTTLFQPCSGNVATQIHQGNTFSVAFDMTKAPHAPGQNGLVFLKAVPESNFQPAGPLQLSNEGLSDKIAFMSIGSVKATVFGEPATVLRLYLVGTPNGDVFSWETGIIVDNCIVTNGEVDSSITSRLGDQTQGA